MPPNRFNGFTEYGVGIDLRIPHYRDILEKKPVVDWFEIISENDIVDGGRPLAVLDQILEQCRVVQHGVFRIMDALSEDFPGLQTILSAKRFRAMAKAYLTECPSHLFTLRNLGSRLSPGLRSHPEWLQPNDRLVRDMTDLEWAHIEAFDAAELPALKAEDLANEEPGLRLIRPTLL